MDKLLTIKEAALFLNVSEMSLRRWTNAGQLKCYRVGGNKERRFDRQDLINFLNPGQRGTTPLGLGDHKVDNSSHIVQFYQSLDESLATGINYISKGLSLGEKALVVSTAARLPLLLEGLGNRGFPVENLIGDGSIITDTGRSIPAEQIQFMTKAVSTTRGFRLLGDMAWALEKKWSLDDLTILENYTNSALADKNKLFLCQYDIEQFPASVAMMALDTHPLTSYRGELKESPYFAGTA
ncbi:MAG: MEDS domain-containing protein [Proteobacteria bacterium]|nr:MEDS domain-containing protein [Pseudomonadota bacterium]MBU1714574.1 MEDS domain-containing protein [Pseudomonadota bacterium]